MAEPVNDKEHAVIEWGVLALDRKDSALQAQPDWGMGPLIAALGEGLAHQFFWKAATDTIQTYEHRLSYRHIHLCKETGQFYNQQREPITVDAAILHALVYDRRPAQEMTLAPALHEPNLQPFMRVFAHGGERLSLPEPKALPAVRRNGFFAAFRALMSFKTAPHAVRAESQQRALANFEQHELKVSAFTRRTV